MDPRDVHQVGLDELAMIDEERRAIARDEGFGDDVEAYRQAVAADPANQAATREELVARATEDIARAGEVAPRVFGRLPRAGCEVRPVEAFKEKDAPFAYYYPPTARRLAVRHLLRQHLRPAEPDVLQARVHDVPRGDPRPPLPDHAWRWSTRASTSSGASGSRLTGAAYVEGWGLYSERLADELGLYRNPAERLGMLDAQAWRASRLIVDSGMHGLGWTRQQSIDWLLRTGLSETDAVIETDRYIVLARPGAVLHDRDARDPPAPAGAGGPRRRRVRHQRFHDELIGHGSLPLATLARELPTWVTPAG